MSETRPQGYCKDCRVEPAEARADGSLASRCRVCADARNASLKAARAEAKTKGLCAWEGGGCKRKAVDGKTYCKTHLAYHRERRSAN